MSGTFLQRSRHGTVWHFRRRIPDDLRLLIGHPYIVKSLGTERRREAVIRARALGVQTDALFIKLRGMEQEKGLRIDYALGLDPEMLSLFGRKVAKATDIKPGEATEAAAAVATYQAFLDGEPIPATAVLAPTEKPFGMGFKGAVEDYLSKSNASIRSKATYRTRLNNAMEFFGVDTDIRYLEKANMVRYSAHIKKTVESHNSQKFFISQTLTLVNWMRDTYQWGPELSSKNLFSKKTTPDSGDRDAFTMEQMKVIFGNAKQYKTKCPEKYWATLATAFLGCRINELAQINLDSDLIQHENGFWYIRIAESDSEQSVKNLASWRMLPIHPALEKHGFIEFLLAQRAKGSNRRPFETQWKARILKDKENGSGDEPKSHYVWSSYVTSWGKKELRTLREMVLITAPDKKLGYFHSMRHSFEGFMVDEKIQFDYREAVIGHQYGSKDAERYAKLKRNPDTL